MTVGSSLDRHVDRDDCWNRIGNQGDGTCARLVAHVHCRNCEVYSAAARSLLDVELPAGYLDHWTNHVARPLEQPERRDESVLVVRSAGEWFAVSTLRCAEVVSERPIRTLPHRRSPAVLGLVNVRGELLVCFSLAALLRLQVGADAHDRRLLVVTGDHAPVALRVDEVHGTHRFNSRDLAAVPSTARATKMPGAAVDAGDFIVGGTLRWRDHTLGLLDEGALCARMARSLT